MNLDPSAGPTPLPAVGDWVRFSLDWRVREGRVVRSNWPSLVVRFLGDEVPTVFPWAFHYYPLDSWGEGFEVIQKPKRADEIERRVDAGVIGVLEASRALGISQKALRLLLRSGKLEGEQVDGHWVSVTRDSLEARKRG